MTNEMLESWQSRFIEWLKINWVHEDSAHDIHHLHRVWRNCLTIHAGENETADLLVLLAAAYFHDIIALSKDHPERQKASLLSADRTVEIFDTVFTDFRKDKFAGIHHAIHAHSFSANLAAGTIEARILQDADRMEALGAMGISRLFYTAGKMNGVLYNAADPLGTARELDDKKFALDHIEVKLLRLPATMQTKTGKLMAAKEAEYIRTFRNKLMEEISTGEPIEKI